MSSNPHQILSAFADNIVEYVLESLGENDVLSIFIAGSVAQDNIAVFDDSGLLEVYSDLDMYVVISERLDLETTRRRIRDYAASLPRDFPDYRLYPEPDVGVYSERNLILQKTRPGTVDIGATHRVLFGNKDVLKWTRRFIASAIDPSESLYLLENRLAEIMELNDRLDAQDSAGSRRYVHYVLLKSCVDLVTCVLVVLGEYAASRDERMKRFRSEPVQAQARGLLPAAAFEGIESSYSSLLNLQQRVSVGREELAARSRAVESFLLGSWKRIGERLDPSGSVAWHDLITRRCNRGRWRENLREVLVLGKRMSIPRVTLVLRSPRLAGLSPIESLRMSGLVDTLLRHDGDDVPDGFRVADVNRGKLATGYLTVLDELTRTFGYRDGALLRRSRRLFRETT